MPGRLASTIKVSIPDIRDETMKLPVNKHERGGCRDQFIQEFHRELTRCITEALCASEGQVFFSDLRVPFEGHEEDGQYIMQFEVFDRSKPRKNAYNFHGQNTSQWVYAGAILYQDGRVSTHH